MTSDRKKINQNMKNTDIQIKNYTYKQSSNVFITLSAVHEDCRRRISAGVGGSVDGVRGSPLTIHGFIMHLGQNMFIGRFPSGIHGNRKIAQGR